MKKILFYSLLLLFGCKQNKLAQFRKLSDAEKCWVLAHPFIVGKTFRITKQVLATTAQVKTDSLLDGDENGGQVDAFRHCYWMAMLTQQLKAHKVYRLGIAHEKGNKDAFLKGKQEEGALPDSLSSVMDIINNQIGIEIGVRNKLQNNLLSGDQLKAEVIDYILKGQLRVLLKDKNKNYLTCSGEVINISLYKNTWYIPKCIVKSNYTFDD